MWDGPAGHQRRLELYSHSQSVGMGKPSRKSAPRQVRDILDGARRVPPLDPPEFLTPGVSMSRLLSCQFLPGTLGRAALIPMKSHSGTEDGTGRAQPGSSCRNQGWGAGKHGPKCVTGGCSGSSLSAGINYGTIRAGNSGKGREQGWANLKQCRRLEPGLGPSSAGTGSSRPAPGAGSRRSHPGELQGPPAARFPRTGAGMTGSSGGEQPHGEPDPGAQCQSQVPVPIPGANPDPKCQSQH